MSDIFDLLERIRDKPAMYLGADSEHRAAQLRGLEQLLCGYESAIDLHDVDEVGRGFSRKFAEYLRARFSWSMSCGPIAAVESAYESDAEMWTQFWVLIDDFRRHLAASR